MLERTFGVILVLSTTLIIALILIRLRILDGAVMGRALFLLLECIGAAAMFLAVNLALGAGIIIVTRILGLPFVALYALQDVMLLILSILQGFAFQLWWRAAN